MATEIKRVKTTIEHLESGAKYVGSAVTLSSAIVGITMFFVPEWLPIAAYIGAILTFVINMLLIILVKVEKDE